MLPIVQRGEKPAPKCEECVMTDSGRYLGVSNEKNSLYYFKHKYLVSAERAL